MKSIIVAAAIFAALGSTAVPAHADHHSTQVPRIQFTYHEPVLTEKTVTWRWKLVNTGDTDAQNVIVIHRLMPRLAVQTLDPACTAGRKRTRCVYQTLAAGRQVTGMLVAKLPAQASGTVQIQGRVSWQSILTGREAMRQARPAQAR